jgi:Transmembrane secretion effector
VVWIADFISNLGFFAQAVGTGWLMTSLTTNAAIVSLVQTAASLPLLAVAIPAGVLADLEIDHALLAGPKYFADTQRPPSQEPRSRYQPE